MNTLHTIVPIDPNTGTISQFFPKSPPLEEESKIKERISALLIEQNYKSPAEQALFSYALGEIYGDGPLQDDEEYYIDRNQLYRIYPKVIQKFFALGLGGIPDKDNALLRNHFDSGAYTQDYIQFSGVNSLFEVHQSLHGDVSIQNLPLGAPQMELFPLYWKSLEGEMNQGFRLYQETSSFVVGLLISFIRSQQPVGLLQKLVSDFKEDQQRSCAAADSGTKDDILRLAKREILSEIRLIDSPREDVVASEYVGWIYGGSQIFLNMYFRTREGKIDICGRGKSQSFPLCTINIQDVPSLLRALHLFPGRSGNFCQLLLQEILPFMKKK